MATDTDPATGTGRTGTGRTGITRPVLLAGIVLGTTLTVLAMWNGARLRVPDIPSILGVMLGALIIWVLFMAAAAVLSELTVRHHRAAVRHGWRYGARGARAGARGAGVVARSAAVRSRPWRARITAAAQARWAARRAAGAPPDPEDETGGGNGADCPRCGWPLPADGTCPTCKAGREAGQPDQDLGPTYSWGPADGPYGWPADDPETAHRWAQHMSTDGKPKVVTEYPPGGGPGRTIATYVNGKPVPSTEGDPMTDPDARPRSRRPRGGAGGGGCSPAWKTLIAETADFEPEDDGHLMSWMASEVNGMSSYAESITDVYETAVSGVGLDPVSMAALHDYADAAAEAAQAMATARQKFASHYSEVREFAAAGGLLPHDGRWIRGEGE